MLLVASTHTMGEVRSHVIIYYSFLTKSKENKRVATSLKYCGGPAIYHLATTLQGFKRQFKNVSLLF